MNISEVCIRRPIATSLLMAALALVGIVAFPLLPVAPLPQVDFPTIQVSATVPGASPETMAATVATPLERQFGQIAGVAQMSSVSSLGSTVITLQFDLNRNIDGAAQDVQAAITAAGSSLPKNLSTPPTYRKVNPADSPILIVSANSDTVPLPKVDDFAENVVAQQISQISRPFASRSIRPSCRRASSRWRTCAPRSPMQRPTWPRARCSASSKA